MLLDKNVYGLSNKTKLDRFVVKKYNKTRHLFFRCNSAATSGVNFMKHFLRL